MLLVLISASPWWRSCNVVSGDAWMELPYGDDSFDVKAEFNTNVTLSCNVTSVPGSHVFRYWIAPDMTIMRENFSASFRTLDGMAGWEVSEDGLEMHAFRIQEAHFGFYYCIRGVEGGGGGGEEEGVMAVKLGINYQGPYWGDLWAKYETNTIVGLTASGSFLAIVIIIAVTWHFRVDGAGTYGDKGSKAWGLGEERGGAGGATPGDGGGYTNLGFQPIQGVGFTPASPEDVQRITGVTMATNTNGKTMTSVL